LIRAAEAVRGERLADTGEDAVATFKDRSAQDIIESVLNGIATRMHWQACLQ